MDCTKHEDSTRNRGMQAEEAAAVLGVGRTTFFRLVRNDRRLQPIKVGRSMPLWTANMLQSYLAEKEVERFVDCGPRSDKSYAQGGSR